MKRHFWFSFLLVVSVTTIVCPKCMGQYVYWADPRAQTINRAKTDGSDRQILISSNLGLRDFALDLVNGKIYWTNEVERAIERSNLNGSGRETVVPNVSQPFGIALDTITSKIYWSAHSPSRVQRCDFDGQNTEMIISSGVSRPRHLALDLTGGYLYVVSDALQANGTTVGRIRRARLDGTSLTLLVSGPGQPTQISLDHQAGKIYWGETVTNLIKRANFDGSGVEIIVGPGLVSPLGIAVDPWGRNLYWGDNVTDDSFTPDARIRRSNMNGGDIEEVVPSGLFLPRTLALFTECIDAGDATPCHDGNPCTDGDHCENQQCVGYFNANDCNDGNSCTDNDHCDTGRCIGEPVPLLCDDRDQCTSNDACDAGLCLGVENPDSCFRMFLMVTQVNGVTCPSCPTNDLPLHEVRPGDIVTVEVFLEDWEDDPDTGVCETDALCSVAAQDCTGSHCEFALEQPCQSDDECGSKGPCILDQCSPSPGIQAYQWTLDFAGLSNGTAGFLSPLAIPCGADSDCNHSIASCSCESATCSNHYCDFRGALFVDTSRPDYPFRSTPQYVIFWGDNPINPFPGVGAFTEPYGVADNGKPAYLGSLLLRVSDDARGTFVVDIDRGYDYTFILDQEAFLIEGLSFTTATINLCEVVDSPNDCNANDYPDECEPDGDEDGVIDDCDLCPVDPANDADGDGVCESQDSCPDDALKSAPGTCGCGLPDSGDADIDGVLDCVDACPGVNDALYGSDCASAIPAVSSWGLVILALLMLTVAKMETRLRKVGHGHARE